MDSCGIIDVKMPSPLHLEPIRAHILARLERELAPELTYHDVGHTRDDVVPAALRLGRWHGLDAHDLELLEIAALFHDIGYSKQSQGHEAVSVRIARETLPRFGVDPGSIDRIADTIMATQLPQTPKDLLGELLADADLDVLGREDFFERNRALRGEMASRGEIASDLEWFRHQVTFLEDHSYFTDGAQATRNAGKQRNLDEVRRRLAALEKDHATD